jgi:signal peptidase complex subunit 1
MFTPTRTYGAWEIAESDQAIAFMVGYIWQDIFLTMWICLAGSIGTVLVVVPPWPFYNRNPEHWLRSGKGGMGTLDVAIGGTKIQ